MKRRIALASEVTGFLSAAGLCDEQMNVVPFQLRPLPKDYSVRKFAREVNPQFDREVK
jgi:hypothetical protein